MNQRNDVNYCRWLYVLIGLAVLVNFSGLFVTILGPDGTYYAGIAKTMVQKNDYINLYVQGRDFLDKPHFPFWITAFSFKFFGFKTWAYKIPGILFLMMGVIYTYLFAKKLYNKEVALWSVLILLTAEHIIISNNDVRAEPYLTGLIIAATYHFHVAHTCDNYWHLIWGCVFTACAIMTKGVFAIIPIGGAIIGHLIVTKNWQQLLQIKWVVAIILTAVFILPEIYCLYIQFDLHPEKLIFGRHNVSGLKFFFWDSQFGRFFNTGPIKGSGDPFFFVHTLAWAFLPWSLLLFAAIYQSIKKQAKDIKNSQWYCLCGALLSFLVFSASKFQLPYYLNIVFPLFAIQLAGYLSQVQLDKSKSAIQWIQSFVIALMLLLIIALQFFFKPSIITWSLIVMEVILAGLLFYVRVLFIITDVRKTIIQSVLAALIVNFYLNLSFYPSLLKYQAGSEAAFYINQQNKANYPVTQSGDEYNFPLGFYIKDSVITVDKTGIGSLPAKPFYLVSNSHIIKGLTDKGWNVIPVKSFDSFWVSMLKPKFLNSKTRRETLDTLHVVLVK